MAQKRKLTALGRALVATVALGGGVAAAAAAEVVSVQQPSVVVRAGKGARSPEVVTLKKGAKLEVLERDERGWLRVRVGDREGYVFERAVAKSGGGPGLGDLVGANAEASNLGTAAAGKGVNADAEAYASARGLDPAPVDRLVAKNQALTQQELDAFKAEGGVGVR